MKFCRDCVSYVDIETTGQESEHRPWRKKCVYGLEMVNDLVEGYRYYSGEPVDPSLERNNIGNNRANHCGRDAQYYKRKWWKFWRPR